jgi:hypothetical protein
LAVNIGMVGHGQLTIHHKFRSKLAELKIAFRDGGLVAGVTRHGDALERRQRSKADASSAVAPGC